MYDDLDDQELVDQSSRLGSDKKFEEALALDRELLTRHPENEDYKIRLAEHLFQASNQLPDQEADRILSYLDEAIDLSPNRGNFYNNRGVFWYNKGEYEKAIADYAQAISKKDDDPDFYENLGDCYYFGVKKIGEAIANYNKCIELHEKTTPIADKDLSVIYHYRGDCRYEAKDFKGAVSDYTREIELNKKISPDNAKEYANIYNDRGLAWYAQYQYPEAIADYEAALNGDEELVFCHHNLYLSCIKTGQYDLAYDHLRKAMELYRQELDIEPEAGDADDRILYYRFLAELYLYTYVDGEMVEIEPLLESGLRLSPDDWDLNITAAKYFDAKKYLVCQSNTSRDKLSLLEDKVLTLQNDCLRMANRHYKTVCRLFSEDIVARTDRDKMAEMASLHLLFENTEAAEKLYDDALVQDEGHVVSLVGKGVILAGRKSYEDSISQFRKAYGFDCDDLNIQSNIAEAHFRSGHYTESERIYKKILAVAAHNQDAIIGLGELFKTMGDQAREKTNKTDAEDYYKWAGEWYGKALEWQVSFDAEKVIPSRRLSMNDLASIQYSVAYIHCCLYELTATATFQDRSLLRTARSSFKRICKGTDDYYKAQASIRKIDKALSTNGFLTTKTGAGLVIGLAILLLLGIQYVFFFPGMQTQTTWSVSSSRLRGWADSFRQGRLYPVISKVTDTPFPSLQALEKAYHNALGAHDTTNMLDIGRIATALPHTSRTDRQLSEASYIAITFGCLLFIIAGFFMGQVSKLKVAGLELEKNVIDQINTNLQSLGISPAD